MPAPSKLSTTEVCDKFDMKRRNFKKLTDEHWGLFDRASSSWNNLKCQLDATRWFYQCNLSSTCFGYIRPSSGALNVGLQHMVFCTEFLDGWWSWEPLRRSCVRCLCCRAHGTIRTVHTTYAAALKTTTHLKPRCTKPYAATQHSMLLMMGVCTRNMSR